MRLWSDINPLRLATSRQLGVREGIVFPRIVGLPLRLRVGPVVEEDAAASDPMLGPEVDGAFFICGRADDIAAVRIVVEGFRGDVREVAEAVPLGAALRVQFVSESGQWDCGRRLGYAIWRDAYLSS